MTEGSSRLTKVRGVSLDLVAGEIHALVGENGAGKSTLIKLMTGLHRPDGGHLAVEGEHVELRSPADAQSLGIACIYQEALVFPDLTVSENIFETPGTLAAAVAAMQDEPVNARWQTMMAPYFDTGTTPADQQMRALEEVFHLP